MRMSRLILWLILWRLFPDLMQNIVGVTLGVGGAFAVMKGLAWFWRFCWSPGGDWGKVKHAY